MANAAQPSLLVMYNIQSFRGRHRPATPLRLGHAWLRTANNVHVTDTGALGQRDGYQLVSAGAYNNAFSTFDYGAASLRAGQSSLSISTAWCLPR